MIQVHLTRHDGADKKYDSIKWALDTHVSHGVRKEFSDQFQYAVLYGNEDSPERIEFWYDLSPSHDQKPVLIWTPESNTEGHKVTITLETNDNSAFNDLVRLALGLKGLANPKVTVRHTVYWDEWMEDRDDHLPF